MNATLLNFAAGETSPRSRGRFDAPWYPSSCKKLVNFTPEVPGSARFRSGFKFLRQTRAGGVAKLIPFEISNTAAYQLEFTDSKMRIYDVDTQDLLTLERTTISGISRANPAVISVASASNLANGDEVIITGIDGMEELNGRQVQLQGNVGLTFRLVDPVTGDAIDSRNFGAYSSGGTLREVYEVSSPYLADEIADIKYAQSLDTMYLFHPKYQPRKITVDSAELFTLATFTRTNDPLNAYAATLTVTAVNQVAPSTLITFTAGDVVNEDVTYAFSTFVGMVEINGGSYRLDSTTPSGGKPRAFLKDASTGAHVNSSSWGAYISGGIAESAAECPLGGAFYESRLFYTGTNQRPDTILASRAPDNDGNNRYDDFTGGSNADDACFFALAPVNGKPDYISWGRGTSTYLFVGTLGGPFRVSGGGLEEPITQGDINVRQFDSIGCEALMPAGTSRLFFVQRGGRKVYTAQFSDDVNDFRSYDMTINADQVGYSPLQGVVLQTGTPNILWAWREDGILMGMSVEGSENVAGWHRVKVGGSDASVLCASIASRDDKDSQLWIVTERQVNGITRHFVEAQADVVNFPDIEDFYSGSEEVFNADDTEDLPGPINLNRIDDLVAWKAAVYRRQEEYIYLDAAATYDGSDRGVAALSSVTPGALTGTGITFTADVAVFEADDVGDEIWKKPNRDTGLGTGRAVITAFVNSRQVTCEIVEDFDTTSVIAYGEWYFATNTFFNLWHLEGETVGALFDGAVYSDGRGGRSYPLLRPANGKITLTDDSVAAVAHFGIPYEGFLQTQNLSVNSQAGPVHNKPRNISEMYVRFLDTLGVDYGTDLYKLEQVHWMSAGDVTDRPSPIYSGVRRLSYPDSWSGDDSKLEKYVFISQRLPLPCVVQSIGLEYSTADE